MILEIPWEIKTPGSSRTALIAWGLSIETSLKNRTKTALYIENAIKMQ